MTTKRAVPSERLRKLIASEAKVSEPYDVTDTISVKPLTPKRSDAMATAATGISIQNSLMNKAMRRAAAPRPAYPTPPAPPEAPTNFKDPKQVAAYEKAVGSYEKAIEAWRGLVAEWERLQANWEAELERLEGAMNAAADKVQQHSDEYTKAMFGDAYDAVIEFFDDQPIEWWNAFVTDIKDAFGIAAKPSQVPDDGCCKECGHVVDEEKAGKAPESST